jgi:hypothetical protein
MMKMAQGQRSTEEKVMRNNGQAKNGHGQGGNVEELLAGLNHGERVQKLGEMLADIKKKTPRPETPPPPSPTGPNGQTTADGRDGKSGRFTPGNQCGRGNPHARRQAALRAVLEDAVGEERLRRIAGKLADLAEQGNLEAAKLLFAYLLGKPREAPDPDRLDLEEWRLAANYPSRNAILLREMEGLPSPRITWPGD